MPDIWDPLYWWLRLEQWRLRFKGFKYFRVKEGRDSFGCYLRRGEDDSTPIIFLHGIALFPEWWKALLLRFSPTRTLVVPELLGYGRSPGRALTPEAFTLKLYRKQIRRLKEIHGWDRMIVAGVSLGGWVALDYALAHPADTQSLILAAPAGSAGDVTEEDLIALREIFDYRTPEEFIDLINNYVLYRPKAIPRWVGALAVRRSERNGHKHFLHNVSFEDWAGGRIDEIEAPTALIWGREDKVFPYRVGEAMERAMPCARLFPMEDTGHSYLFERPEEFSARFFEALEFVEKRSAAPGG